MPINWKSISGIQGSTSALQAGASLIDSGLSGISNRFNKEQEKVEDRVFGESQAIFQRETNGLNANEFENYLANLSGNQRQSLNRNSDPDYFNKIISQKRKSEQEKKIFDLKVDGFQDASDDRDARQKKDAAKLKHSGFFSRMAMATSLNEVNLLRDEISALPAEIRAEAAESLNRSTINLKEINREDLKHNRQLELNARQDKLFREEEASKLKSKANKELANSVSAVSQEDLLQGLGSAKSIAEKNIYLKQAAKNFVNEFRSGARYEDFKKLVGQYSGEEFPNIKLSEKEFYALRTSTFTNEEIANSRLISGNSNAMLADYVSGGLGNIDPEVVKNYIRKIVKDNSDVNIVKSFLGDLNSSASEQDYTARKLQVVADRVAKSFSLKTIPAGVFQAAMNDMGHSLAYDREGNFPRFHDTLSKHMKEYISLSKNSPNNTSP